MGKKVDVRPDWEDVKLRIMWDLVQQKFTYRDLRMKLKSVKEPIVEHNQWHDNYWGVCTCDKCKNVESKNWLEKILKHLKGVIM